VRIPTDPQPSTRTYVAGALLLLGLHGRCAFSAPLSADELVVVDLGRMLRSGCLGGLDVPWDQPPGAYLIAAAASALAEAAGLDLVAADQATVLAIRTLAALLIVLGWAALHPRLPAGLPRVAWLLGCGLSTALLGASTLAMAHSLAAGLGGLLLFGLAAEGRRARLVAAGSLAALVLVSWAAWALVPVVAVFLLRDPGRLRDRLVPIAPAVLLGALWLVVTWLQIDWVLERAGRADGGGGGSLPVLRALSSFVAGRHRSPGAIVASSGGLLALCLLGAWSSDRLTRAARFLTFGPWLVLAAAAPVIWLGHDKFVLFLAPPTLLLAALGAGRAAASPPKRRALALALATAVLLSLGVSGARFGAAVGSRASPRVARVAPLGWHCADPFEFAVDRALAAAESEGSRPR
jgi:hypothetical protein